MNEQPMLTIKQLYQKYCQLDRIVRGKGIDDGITGRLYSLEQQAERAKNHEEAMKNQEKEIRLLWMWLVVTIIGALVALTTSIMQAWG